jgi:hypothetical protein
VAVVPGSKRRCRGKATCGNSQAAEEYSAICVGHDAYTLLFKANHRQMVLGCNS